MKCEFGTLVLLVTRSNYFPISLIITHIFTFPVQCAAKADNVWIGSNHSNQLLTKTVCQNRKKMTEMFLVTISLDDLDIS